MNHSFVYPINIYQLSENSYGPHPFKCLQSAGRSTKTGIILALLLTKDTSSLQSGYPSSRPPHHCHRKEMAAQQQRVCCFFPLCSLLPHVYSQFQTGLTCLIILIPWKQDALLQTGDQEAPLTPEAMGTPALPTPRYFQDILEFDLQNKFSELRRGHNLPLPSLHRRKR